MFGRVADNIADYLRGAILPELTVPSDIPLTVVPDPRLKSTLNLLAIEPAEWRKLMNVVPFRDAYASDKLDWEGNCRVWLEEFFPEGFRKGIAADQCALVTVPNGGYKVKVKPAWSPNPDSVSRSADSAIPSRHHLNSVTSIANWVDEYPLQTVQRIIHQCFPPWREFAWRPLSHKSEDEHDLWKMFVWTQERKASATKPAWHHGIVVAVQPAWALTEADFKAFAMGGALNVRTDPDARTTSSEDMNMDIVDTPIDRPGSKWPTSSRIWAKLWDACVMQGCYYFVLTSYKNWVFGRFSERRSIGYISDVVPYNVKGPTIVERLIYWVGVAADPKTHFIPYIQEPFDGVGDPASDKIFRDVVESAIRGMRRFAPPPSDYDWGDHGSEAGSSAGVTLTHMAVSEIGSDAGSDGGNSDIGNDNISVDFPIMEGVEIEPSTPTTRAAMIDEEEIANWLLNPPDTPRMVAEDDSDLESVLDSGSEEDLATAQRTARNLRVFNALPHPALPRPVAQAIPVLEIPFSDPNRMQITGGCWMV